MESLILSSRGYKKCLMDVLPHLRKISVCQIGAAHLWPSCYEKKSAKAMMNKILRYLVGPELLWLLACLWASTFKKINVLREGQYDQIIENWATFLPVILLTMSMVLFAFPMIPRKFLLLRIIVVAIISTNFLLEYTLNAHTGGGPGVGTIYLVGYILLLVAVPIVIVLKLLLIK